MSSDSNSFSKLALSLIQIFETRENLLNDEKITVNDLVTKVASWYEKFRTAMDYGSEETIPRRAIERMLKRMFFLDQNEKKIAENLVRELIWAGYFPNETVPQSLINQVATSIKLYLKLKEKLSDKKILSNDKLNEFIMQILSCEIFFILIPNREKDAVANFMFKILKDSVIIEDDSEQTKDLQVFIAVRKSFARDDIAFLRYKLFNQIFTTLTEDNFEKTLEEFEKGYKEIKFQLTYPKKERIFNHIKKCTPAFLILYDLLIEEKGYIKTLSQNEESFKRRVFEACQRRYKSIKRKVRTAIVRSFIFILITKSIMALSIEGVFESIFLGSITWSSIILNTILPPLIMVGVGIGIKTPSDKNSHFIFNDIQRILFEEKPLITPTLSLKLKTDGTKNVKDYIFSIFWLFSILLAFGIIWWFLGILHFNLLSKGVFLFFIAIISFLSYRIYQIASSYTVVKRQNILTPLFDFFFVPVIRVGQRLTEGITQISFILLIIDFIIEAPFKGLIGFFEQWFLFVATKREEME